MLIQSSQALLPVPPFTRDVDCRPQNVTYLETPSFLGHTAWLVGVPFPDQGSNPGPQEHELGVLITGLPGIHL